jgi:hypothetical protein
MNRTPLLFLCVLFSVWHDGLWSSRESRQSILACAADSAADIADTTTTNPPNTAPSSSTEPPSKPTATPNSKKSKPKHRRKRKKTSSSSASGRRKPGQICDSLQGHRFNAVPPAKKNSYNPLSFCQGYWKNTCCNKSHTDVLLRKDRIVAAAKFSANCRHYSEMMQCSSCHPGVGTGAIKHICNSTCNSWYHACNEEFFASSSSVGGVLTPCLEHHMICSRLDTFVNNGPEFCQAMGFEPEPAPLSLEEEEELELLNEGKKRRPKLKCFDGTVPNTEGSPSPSPPRQSDMSDLFKKYRRTRAGRAADQFVDMLDGVPTWVMVASSLLIGALLAGRILLAGGVEGRRLGSYDDDDWRDDAPGGQLQQQQQQQQQSGKKGREEGEGAAGGAGKIDAGGTFEGIGGGVDMDFK